MIEPVIKKLKENGINNYELIVKQNRKTVVIVKNGNMENLKSSSETTYTLKIIKDKKVGLTYFTSNESDLDKIVNRAVELSSYNTPDPLNSFYNNEFPENSIKNLLNKKIENISIEQQLEKALLIEEYAYKFDRRINIVNEAQCFKGSVNVRYINSNGIDKEYATNYTGGAVVVVAKENSSQMTGYEHFITKNDSVDSKKIAENAGFKAVRMLNASKAKSANYPIIIENELVADLFTIIAPSFYIENIEKNKSLFSKYRIGETIASKNLTLIDDATNKNYIGAAKFDDEGVPTSKKVLINKGILNNHLYNLYYAKKRNSNFAGNSFLPNFKSFQSITYSNLILSKGKMSLQEGIKSLSSGIFLTTLMGLHMADAISGDFSLGAEGILIENGELTKPVKEFVVSGNIKDILKNCKMVYNDSKVSGSLITPSILVEGLTISGN